MRSPAVLRVLVQLNHFVPARDYWFRASVTLTHRFRKKVRKKSRWKSSRNNTMVSSIPLISRIEHSHKNLLPNYFLNLGKKDLMETAATRNVQKKWQI